MERVSFFNIHNGFRVLRIRVRAQYGTVTIIGSSLS